MLFDKYSDNWLHRPTDPNPSKVAAEEIRPKLGRLQAEFIQNLKARGGSATANEVAQGVESIRKRARELVKAGVIIEGGERICRRTGKLATVYRINPLT